MPVRVAHLISFVAWLLCGFGCADPCTLDVDCPFTQVCVSSRCVEPQKPDAQISSDGDADMAADVGVDGDVDAEMDARGDADHGSPADGDVDGRALDGDHEASPGPWSSVVAAVTVSAERQCDVDDDGFLDNSLAELGTESGADAAEGLSHFAARGLDSAVRLMVHAPHCDDLSIPHDLQMRLGLFSVDDVDDPSDPRDDFSGTEGFFAVGSSLSSCGEPLFVVGASMDHGHLSTEPGLVLIPFGPVPVPMSGAVVDGMVSAGGAAANLRVCGYILASDLGGITDPMGTTEFTMLEMLLYAGWAIGRLDVQNVQPDVDLDHDGLERFNVDPTTGALVSCQDGNGDVFVGRDCWSNVEINDAFSMTLHVTTIATPFVGCEPTWQDEATIPCKEPAEDVVCVSGP